jgi:hypothetical protein
VPLAADAVQTFGQILIGMDQPSRRWISKYDVKETAPALGGVLGPV